MTTRICFNICYAAVVAIACACAEPLCAQESAPNRAAAPTNGSSTNAVVNVEKDAPLPVTSAAPRLVGAAVQADEKTTTAATKEPCAQSSTTNDVFLRYRYWMVPEALIDRWPWGGQKYVPIKAADFKKWLETTRARATLQDYADGLLFSGVVTKLRLYAAVNEETLEGSGRLETKNFKFHDPTDQNDVTHTPSLLDFGIAASYPRADRADLVDAFAAYPDGRIYLPNADGKSRRFFWSHRGKRDANGSLVYDFHFSSESSVELLLKTANDVVVTADGAIVTPIQPSLGEELLDEFDDPFANAEIAADDALEQDDDYVADDVQQSAPSQREALSQDARWWRVSFTDRETASLYLAHESLRSAPTRPLGFRQESSYRIALTGVEATSKFEIEGFPNLQNEATLVLDPGLALNSVEFGGSTNVRRLATTVDPDGTTRVRIRVPLSAGNDAAGDLRVAAFCRLWEGERQLPRIRLEEDSLVWHESVVRVAAAPPILVADVETIDAAQARDASRSRSEGRVAMTFKLFNPDATARLTLRRDERTPLFDSATDCYFAANEISARVSLFLKTSAADGNRVTLPLAAGWDVDSVVGATPDAVEWTRETDRVDSKRRLLKLVFNSAAPTDGAVRVSFAARYVAPVEERVAADRLSPLDLAETLRGAHLLAIRTDASSQIRLVNAAGRPFLPVETQPDFIFSEALVRDATPATSGGARLWFGDQSVDAYAKLESVRSNYAVSYSARCALDDEAMKQTWKLHCVPASGKRVESVVFFVAPSTPDLDDADAGYDQANLPTWADVSSSLKWNWSTTTEPDRRYEARRLSYAEARAFHAPTDVDAYEIKLATSRSVPFDVNLFCNLPATRSIQIPLVFFPDVDEETVEIVVESTNGALFKTSGISVTESTAPADDANASWLLKKAFRYNPSAIFNDADDQLAMNVHIPPRRPLNQANLLANVDRRVSVVPRLSLTLLSRGNSSAFSEHVESEGDVLPMNSLCWYANHDSYYQSDGGVNHRVTFFLENRGRNDVRLSFTTPKKRRVGTWSKSKNEGSVEEFYEVGAFPEEALADPDFFTGVLDFHYDWNCVKSSDVFDSIASLKVDGEHAKWSLWKRLDEDDDNDTYVIDVRLLAKRRYVRVELDFAQDVGSQLSSGRRIRPIEFSCDAPTLSGVWNAWFPPQYQTRRDYFHNASAENAAKRVASYFNVITQPSPDNRALKEAANRVASRLGDSFALRLAVGEARRADSDAVAKAKRKQAAADSVDASDHDEKKPDESKNAQGKSDQDANSVGASKSASAALDALRFDAPTWGDVFGSPAMTSSLFAPPADAPFRINSDDPSEPVDVGVDSPFGKLKLSRRHVVILIDHYALRCVGVAPNVPLPNVEATDHLERANRILGDAGVVLTLVDPELAVLTTAEALTRQFAVETKTLCGPAFRRPLTRRDANKMRSELLVPGSRRFLAPEVWRAVAGSMSPWNVERDAFVADVQGWTFVSMPLGRVDEGVYIVNRYMLVALEFVGFVAFVVLCWKFSTTRPQILIGTMGICLAILFPARYEIASLALGVFLGAFTLFAMRLIGVFLPSAANLWPFQRKDGVKRRRKGARDVRRRRVKRVKLKKKVAHEVEAPRRRVSEYDESVSSEGYVDFARMSAEELRYIRGRGNEHPQNPLEPDDNHEEKQFPPRRDDRNEPPRDGFTTMKTILSLAICALTLAALSVAERRVDARTQSGAAAVVGSAGSSTTESAAAPTSSQGAAATERQESVATVGEMKKHAQSAPEHADDYVEPHRVFVPTNDAREPSGEFYWIDSNFYNRIRADLKDSPRERSWRVVDALYEGAVNYNSFTDTTSVFNLKATYVVVTDEPNVTIYLPAVPLATERGARFDKQTAPVSYTDDGTELYVETQGAPGVHLLELSIVPPQFFETTSKLAIPILPVPSARLALDVPDDAPLLDAPTAIGKVTRSPRLFAAELGPVDQLVVTKAAAARRDVKTALDVEQLFLMRARASQTDLRAVFRCQALGEKVEYIEIECDPAYAYSGYCRCDAEEIADVDPPDSRNNTMRIRFKRPTSGSFNLNVDFVARNFSGVGRLSFPRVKTLGGRVVKNWLALATDPVVEVDASRGAESLRAPFTTAWGAEEANITAVYDLDALDEDDVVDVRLVRVAPNVVETTTDLFLPASVLTTFTANLDAVADLFRLHIDVPKPFVVEKITLNDANGATLETPKYDLTSDGLALEFEAPLRGRYTLSIVGRTRRQIDVADKAPIFAVKDALCVERYLRVYCAPNVYLEWDQIPEGWNPLPPDVSKQLGPEPQNARPIELYSIDVSTLDDDQTHRGASDAEIVDAETNRAEFLDGLATLPDSTNPTSRETLDAVPNVCTRLNAPKIEGVERRFLYPVGTDADAPTAWKGAYELRFQTTSGRLDQIYVAADDLFTIDPLPVNSLFSVAEGTTPAGVKAYVFTPNRPLFSDGKTVELFFSATFKNGSSGVSMPQFQTLSSAVYEDYSKVARLALLASTVGGTPIEWTTQNMVDMNDDRLNERRRREELVGQIPPGLRSLATFVADSNDAADYRLPVVVDQAFRSSRFTFKLYWRGDDASARIASSSDRLHVTLARYSFFVNERRDVFGAAVFMVRPGANQDCVVVAPPGYHILEARVNGVRRLVERLDDLEYDENGDTIADDEKVEPRDEDRDDADVKPHVVPQKTRWAVELGSSPYVKRLEVSFQAAGEKSTRASVFKSLRRHNETFGVDFMRVEGAETRRRLWSCVFEDFDAVDGAARWNVAQLYLGRDDDEPTIERVERECVPVALEECGDAYSRVAAEYVSALLAAYEYDAATLANSNSADLKRMRERWAVAWSENAAVSSSYLAVTRQNRALPPTLSDSLVRAIAVVNDGEFLPVEDVDANYPAPNWNAARIATIQATRDRILKDVEKDVDLAALVPAVNAQSLWTLNTGSYAQCVFGSTNEDVVRVEFNVSPKPFDFLASPYAAAVFLLMATAALLQLLDARAKAKGLRSLIHVAFVFMWAVCFFLFGWTLAALIGAFLLATLPFAVEAIRRRLTTRKEDEKNLTTNEQERVDDDSTPPNNGSTKEKDEFSTTELLPGVEDLVTSLETKGPKHETSNETSLEFDPADNVSQYIRHKRPREDDSDEERFID